MFPPSKFGAYSGKTKGRMETLGLQGWTREKGTEPSPEERVKNRGLGWVTEML